MLLNELFNPLRILIEREAREKRKIGSIPVIVTNQDPRSFTRTKKRGEPMGAGVQSAAYDHKNGVVKYTDLINDEDPALKFINISLYNQKNPYMPKYKSVKVYQDAKGYLTMVSVSEKLVSNLGEYALGPEQVDGLKKIELSAAGKAELDRLRKVHSNRFDGEQLDGVALGHMFRSLNKVDLARIPHFFNDTDLIRAVEIISHFADDDIDMHGGNFMFRPNGQLVILDPVLARDDKSMRDWAGRPPREEPIEGEHESDDEFAVAFEFLEHTVKEIEKGLTTGMFMDIAEAKIRKNIPVIENKIKEFKDDLRYATTVEKRNELLSRVEKFITMTNSYIERNKEI